MGPAHSTLSHEFPQGVDKGLIWFGTAGFVNSFGTGLFFPFQILFYRQVFDLQLTIVGIGLAIGTFLVLPALFGVGRLVDRFGPRMLMVTAGLLKGVTFAAYAFGGGFGAFLALTMVAGLCGQVQRTAQPILAASASRFGETARWLAVSRVVFNLGIGGGAVVVSLLLVNDRQGFVMIGLLTAAGFIVSALMYRVLPNRHFEHPPAASKPTTGPWRDRAYLSVMFTNFVVFTAMITVESALAIYLVEVNLMPVWIVGALFAVNTVLITCLQIPVGVRLQRFRPESTVALGAALHGALFIALLCVTGLSFPWQVIVLGIGMVIYTVGELIAGQTLLHLSVSIPGAGQRGSYQSANQIFVGVAYGVAPALSTTLLSYNALALWCALLLAVVVVAWAWARNSTHHADGTSDADVA